MVTAILAATAIPTNIVMLMSTPMFTLIATGTGT
jgi:hypothetical protein